MDNISHFWQWFRQGLASVVTSATEGKVEDDETKTIIIGYSAGKMMQNHSFNTEIDKIGHTGATSPSNLLSRNQQEASRQ